MGQKSAEEAEGVVVGTEAPQGAAIAAAFLPSRLEVCSFVTPFAVTHALFEACGGSKSAGSPGIRLSISATRWPHRVVDVESDKENAMKTNGRKRHTDYGKQDLAVLADAGGG